MRHLLPFLLVTCALAAGASEDVSPALVMPGAVLFKDSFDGPRMDDRWKLAVGTWVIKDGALEGSEKPEDHHAAACNVKVALPTSCIITYRVCFDGGDMGRIIFNGDAAHIGGVTMKPDGFSLAFVKDKKKEGGDETVSFGTVKQTFSPGQWYTFTIEISGDEILVRTDAEHFIYGKDPKVARAKTAVALRAFKSSMRYDDIVMRTAEPNPKWDRSKYASKR